MKKLAIFLFALLLPFAAHATAIVVSNDNTVLYASKPDAKRHPASLTKIMTLYMVFEALENGRLKVNQRLRVSRVASSRSPSKLYLKKGETIKVKNAIDALITKSANDVATVLAEAIGGTERKFARMMTAKARKLGMKNTTFRNASGLPHWRQITTARDMAILANALIDDFPKQYQKFSLKEFEFRGRTYHNHNRLLYCYDSIDGIKTGYIRSSGFNLVASAEIDGIRLIGVVIGHRSKISRDRAMLRILNRSFKKVSGQIIRKNPDCKRSAKRK